MAALDGLWEIRAKLRAKKRAIQRAYAALVELEVDTGTLTGAANTATDIKVRIATFRDLFSKFA